MFRIDADGLISYNYQPFARLILHEWQAGYVGEACANLIEREVVDLESIFKETETLKQQIALKLTKQLEKTWIRKDNCAIIEAMVKTILDEEIRNFIDDL